jgi:hypothetical protein
MYRAPGDYLHNALGYWSPAPPEHDLLAYRGSPPSLMGGSRSAKFRRYPPRIVIQRYNCSRRGLPTDIRSGMDCKPCLGSGIVDFGA